MKDIEFFGNIKNCENFVNTVREKDFLFSLVISYTSTCEIPGITIAGSDSELVKFTAPADAEFLHYGYCKSIKSIPMTPDGKPTPALITKSALESASIPLVVINAGSKIEPQLPFIQTGLKPGNNITQNFGLDEESFLRAIDYGRIIGRTLASLTDCLVIGESLPGGTTTALAVMRGLGIDAKVSSSIPKNPVELKNRIVTNALKKLDNDDPFNVVKTVGDPMIPTVAGMLSSASEITKVLLSGGTQMAAVLAFAKSIGYKSDNVAMGTTCYITNDTTANFLEIIKQIDDIPILVVDPKLERSEFSGLQSFSEGFAKEGAGAGGSLIAAMLKAGLDSEKLLQLIENQYKRIFTSP